MATATTDTRQQNLILRLVGDNERDINGLPNGPVGSIIQALWDVNQSYAKTGIPRHQYYKTLINAIEVMLGSLATGQVLEVGTKNQPIDDGKTKTLQALLETTQTELDTLTKQWSALRPPASGKIARTAPIQPGDDPRTVFEPDANDRAYRGDPYFPQVTNVRYP
jgi:hypothetical protein